MKEKIVYFCKECGADYPKAYGRCPACGAWNSFVEQKVRKEPVAKVSGRGFVASGSRPVRIAEVDAHAEMRIDTMNAELNRVLGGGLVPGSLVLIGGEPGIGKSTLVLQVALRMAGKKILSSVASRMKSKFIWEVLGIIWGL